jgi:DNA-binding response OmpR family regulator
MPSAQKKILIVDDEPDIILGLDFLLRQNGYAVQSAADGEAALAAAADFRPDLLLLDIMLPGQSGFDVCRTLRQTPEGRALKIVMLTAKGRDIEIARSRAAGADAYIMKPFSTRDLVAQVHALLRATEP